MKKPPIGLLRIEKGPHEDESLDLYEGACLTVGRSLESDCFIPDNTVSRKHAEFSADDIRIFVRNYGSNGIIVNDVRIEHSEIVTLDPGALVEIGPCKIRVEMPHLEDTFVVYKTMIGKPLNTMKTMVMSAVKSISDSNRPLPTLIASDSNATESAEADSGSKNKGALDSFVDKYLQSTISKIILGLVVLLIFMVIIGDLVGPENDESIKITNKQEVSAEDSEFHLVLPTVVFEEAIPGDTLRSAIRFFRNAEKRFKDRALLERNLYDSIRLWQQGINMTGKYRGRDSVTEFSQAQDKGEYACRTLNQNIEAWEKDIVIKEMQGNYDQANQTVQLMLKSIPDIHHDTYRWAKKYERRLKLKLR